MDFSVAVVHWRTKLQPPSSERAFLDCLGSTCQADSIGRISTDWLKHNHHVTGLARLYCRQCIHTNTTTTYLRELISPYTPQRSLLSQESCLLVVPRSSLKTVGMRAFSAQKHGIPSRRHLDRSIAPVLLRKLLKLIFLRNVLVSETII